MGGNTECGDEVVPALALSLKRYTKTADHQTKERREMEGGRAEDVVYPPGEWHSIISAPSTPRPIAFIPDARQEGSADGFDAKIA